jgi:hypothetical protein
MSWVLMVTAGVWLLVQTFWGDLLGRLNLL